MAVVSKFILFFEDGRNKTLESKEAEFLFKSVSVSVDGNDNGMTISEVGGEFDFNAKNITNVGTVDGVDISGHASRHERGGADEIDGDHLDIDFTPSNYAPSTTPAEADNVDDLAAHLAGIDSALGSLPTSDELAKVSSNDTVSKYLIDALVSASEANTSLAIELKEVNDGGDEDLKIAFDQSKVDHDSLLNFVANEHIDHSGVEIQTAADSGLAGGGDITATRSLSVDIDGTTAITAIDDADTLLVDDGDGGTNRKITRANLLGSASFDMGANKITSSAVPSTDNDLVNKSYADGLAAGVLVKDPVRVASTGSDLGATYNASGGASSNGQFTGAPSALDGVTLAQDDRVLVKDQTDAKQNGIYVVTATTTTWDRSTDFDGTPSNEVKGGASVLVDEGTANINTMFKLDGTGEKTINTDDLDWIIYSRAEAVVGGDGIDKTGLTLSVDLDTDPGLEINAAKLRAKVKSNGGITRDADGLSVNTSDIDDALAGNGLIANAGALDVQVDDQTIELDSDTVKLKASKTYTNNSGTAIASGDVVYINASGEIQQADADEASSNDFQVGVALEAIADTASGKVHIRIGMLVSGFSGLTPGREVFVSAVAGASTQAAPSATGQHVYTIGRAESATEVRFNPRHLVQYA